MIAIITHTPIWVWFVLVGLVAYGLRQRQARQVNPIRLWVMTGVFLPIVLLPIYRSPEPLFELLIWLGGILLGATLAYIPLKKYPLLSKNVHGWRQRGSYLPLVLYLSIFGCRYVGAVLLKICLKCSMAQQALLGLTGVAWGVLLLMISIKTKG